MSAGQPADASVQVTNTGTLTWRTDSPDFVFFTYRWFKQKCQGDSDATTQVLPATVKPGGSVEIKLRLAVPNQPGIYCLEFDLGHYGVTFFGAVGAPTQRSVVQVR